MCWSGVLDSGERFINRDLPLWLKPGQPIWSFTGREKELREIHEWFREDEDHAAVVISQDPTSSGGLGKSELAKKYAWDRDEFYGGNILWLKADSTNIWNSFQKVYTWLYLDRGVSENNIAETRYVVDDTYKLLCRGERSLVIFDGVEDFEDVQRYLPKASNFLKRPRILMTANVPVVEGIDGAQVVRLDVLSEGDSVLLVERMLESTTFTREIGDLARILERVPLALKHAAAYITRTGCGVQEYVMLFEKTREDWCSVGREVVDFTVRMTVRALESYGRVGSVAVEILKAMSYLSPEVVQKVLLLPLVAGEGEEEAEKTLNRALDLLEVYSLVEAYEFLGERFTVQRTVQAAVRSIIGGSDGEDILRKAMKAAYGCKIDKIYYSDKVDKAKGLSCYLEILDMRCHFASLWRHACDNSELIGEFYMEPLDCGLTPLHLLTMCGKQEETEKILKHLSSCCLENFDSEEECLETVVNEYSNSQFTPLHVAAIFNRLRAVETLISSGAHVNQKGFEFRTALHFSAERGHVDIVRFLVYEAEANVEEKCLSYYDVDGHTALYEAADNGQVESVRILSKNLSPLDRNKYLFHSILHSDDSRKRDTLDRFFSELDEGTIEELLREGLDGIPPLVIAICRKYIGVVEYLIDKGASIQDQDIEDIEYASISGNLDIVRRVAHRGFDPRQTHRSGYRTTVLHTAALYGHLDIVRYYVDRLDLEVNVIDSSGRSPMYMAAQGVHLDVIKFLLLRGSTMTVVGYFRWWLPRSTIVAKVKKFVSKLMKKCGLAEEVDYVSSDCKSALEEAGLTALNVAAASGDIRKVKRILEGKVMLEEAVSDLYMSMKFAELYRWPKVYDYLFRHLQLLDSGLKHKTWPNLRKKIRRRFLYKCLSVDSLI